MELVDIKTTAKGVSKYARSVRSWFNNGKGFQGENVSIQELNQEVSWFKDNLKPKNGMFLN